MDSRKRENYRLDARCEMREFIALTAKARLGTGTIIPSMHYVITEHTKLVKCLSHKNFSFLVRSAYRNALQNSGS
jgi:hypothetical protein